MTRTTLEDMNDRVYDTLKSSHSHGAKITEECMNMYIRVFLSHLPTPARKWLSVI